MQSAVEKKKREGEGEKPSAAAGDGKSGRGQESTEACQIEARGPARWKKEEEWRKNRDQGNKKGEAQGGETREGKGGGPTSQKEGEKEKLRKRDNKARFFEAMRNQILANVSSWGCLSLLLTMRTRLKDPCIRKGSQNQQRPI